MGYRFLGETQELGDEWTWIQGHGCEDCGPDVACPANLPLTKMVTVFHLFLFNELIDYVI